MKSYLHIAILSLFIIGCTPDNSDSPEPDQVLVKYYGDQSSHRLFDMQTLPDGGFVLFGTKTDEGSVTGSDFYMVITDQFGNMVADAVIDVDSTQDVAAKVKVIEGGYLITGSVADLNAALIPQAKTLFWAHINTSLEIVTFQRIMPADYAASTTPDDEVEGNDIIFLDRNVDSVLVVGSSMVNNQGEFIIHKASIDGATQWTKVFGQTGSDETAVAIFQTPSNGGYGVVCNTSNTQSLEGASGSNIIYYNFNSSVSSEDNFVVVGYADSTSNAYNDVALSAHKRAGSAEIMVTGSSSLGPEFRPLLVSFNEQGGVVTAPQVFQNSFGNAMGQGVTKTQSNSYVIVGTIENFVDDQGTEGALSKGNEILFQKFGITKNFGTENGNDEAVAVRSLSDGSLVVGGTVDFGSGLTLITLMKMNENGDLAR